MEMSEIKCFCTFVKRCENWGNCRLEVHFQFNFQQCYEFYLWICNQVKSRTVLKYYISCKNISMECMKNLGKITRVEWIHIWLSSPVPIILNFWLLYSTWSNNTTGLVWFCTVFYYINRKYNLSKEELNYLKKTCF